MDRNALERFAERVAVSGASPEQHESAIQNLGPIVAPNCQRAWACRWEKLIGRPASSTLAIDRPP
jgi:hypothetical protein